MHRFIAFSFLRVFICAALCLSLLTGCTLPRVSAEERLFLDLSLTFLDAYELPQETFEDTPIGGLSAIAYDRQRDRLYALSDDRSNQAAARFYTLKLNLKTVEESTAIDTVEVEAKTILTAADGNPFPAGSIDPEGLALTPRQSVFISSEGDTDAAIAPLIAEFDLATGQWKGQLPIPERFIPATTDGESIGIQTNKGFESLTLNPTSSTSNWQEPFRLFTATEAPLKQDLVNNSEPNPVRLLHYLIGEDLPTLLSEHLYLLDPPPDATFDYGLSELLALDQAGHFLSLERSFGLTGFNGKIFQIAIGGATDTSGIPALSGSIDGVQPVQKQLILDLSTLDLPLDNFEGMALGPQLPDGTQSLILISDDNFNPLQTTQLLLFQLKPL